jgi:hypothetical protein
MNDESEKKAASTEPRFKYTADNPQPPASPLLTEYMRKNNIDKKMSVEDAKEWFNGLRESLRKKEATGYGR